MTIYAVSSTDKGRRFFTSEKVTLLSVRRMVVLGIVQSNGWHSLGEILQQIKETHKKYLNDKDMCEIVSSLETYAIETTALTLDLRALSDMGFVDLARYRYSDGRLAKEAPIGMVFR